MTMTRDEVLGAISQQLKSTHGNYLACMYNMSHFEQLWYAGNGKFEPISSYCDPERLAEDGYSIIESSPGKWHWALSDMRSQAYATQFQAILAARKQQAAMSVL